MNNTVVLAAFAGLDWAVIGLFCLALIGIVVWVTRQKNNNSADYFLGGKDATWIAIGASLFASNIGRTDMYGGSEEQIRLSLEKLCSLNGNYRVFPGHMNETELEKERMTNPYLKSFAKN